MRTIEIKAYKFDELSEEKEKVISDNYDLNVQQMLRILAQEYQH